MLLIRLYLLFLLLLIFLPSLGSVSIEDDLSLIQNRGELDRYGNLMLVGAAASGRFEVVQALLSQKHGLTQIDRKNKHGDSPLTAAIWGGHLVVAELLIESGANINLYLHSPLCLSQSSACSSLPVYIFFRQLPHLYSGMDSPTNKIGSLFLITIGTTGRLARTGQSS